MEIKKAKRKVDEEQWSTQMGCKVTVIKAGNYPDTLYVRLPDGRETQVDMAYLAKLK